ncbi:hypothetical protein CEXT_161561 [Caerostris extrusa]|uniref:Uncharacterized protein n=1 Tax=Caerostris extrusa TaxID=172846 RepID=A0AAV4MQL3_CAEEX|nr:hypothetical protein CEXT_161561 [Caerostris extrusa]
MLLSCSNNFPSLLELLSNANSDGSTVFSSVCYEICGWVGGWISPFRTLVEMNVKACRQPHLKVFADEAKRKGRVNGRYFFCVSFSASGKNLQGHEYV